MAGLDFSDKIAEASQNITSLEQMLCSGLMQPFNNSNAGARKIMSCTQRQHVFPLMAGEKAIIETGYEIRFGDYSSSITRADADYQIIGKTHEAPLSRLAPTTANTQSHNWSWRTLSRCLPVPPQPSRATCSAHLPPLGT